MSSRCEDELTMRLFVREGDCWDLDRTNSPTSVRHGDGLGYIRIWVTPPRRLVFWDGLPSPYKWYQSHAPNLIVCVGDLRSPKGRKKAQ